MYATFWSLVPPVVAIVLALITKEVYSSLFVGIATAALFYAQFHIVDAYTTMFRDGFIASLSDSSHVGILIFLVVLGTIVVLMNRAGGSAAYGKWAQKRIKTRKGTLFATFALGVLIFVDDYFNCLTVGSIMRPVTDKHNVSRAKLAYIIDATAAPVCMIAPISSWAAAVAGVTADTDGLDLFMRSIPYNLYSLLTIAMIILIIAFDIDFGPMKKHEDNAAKGDLFTCGNRVADDGSMRAISTKGTVVDLAVPVVALIVCCVTGMIYTGGFFEGESFVKAFAGCDASLSLSMGSAAALLFTIIFYLVRRVLTFQDCMNAFPEGFKAMISPVLILTFAWTLKAMTDSLGAKEYVASLVENISGPWLSLFPAIIFIIGALLAFATGTSWGTFGILIPIVVGTFSGINHTMMIISISACMAGAVCGDHCSPISDTTIMASAGAQCNHMNHVSTQLPYVMVVAVISCMTYILAGFIQSPVIPLIIGIVLMIGTLIGIKYITSINSKKKEM